MHSLLVGQMLMEIVPCNGRGGLVRVALVGCMRLVCGLDIVPIRTKVVQCKKVVARMTVCKLATCV